jgi:hypothetical protein
MGMATAPALLGSAMNMRYSSTLKASLPREIAQTASDATMRSLGDSRVLLSAPAMRELREILTKTNSNGEVLFQQTVEAIRTSMEAGLRIVFIIAAGAMFLAFLLILTIPVISIDKPVEDKRASSSVTS